MKIYICQELGCAYRWSKKHKQLEWTPLFGNIIEDNWGTVDEEIVGQEVVIILANEGITTLSQLYRHVEKELAA